MLLNANALVLGLGVFYNLSKQVKLCGYNLNKMYSAWE